MYSVQPLLMRSDQAWNTSEQEPVRDIRVTDQQSVQDVNQSSFNHVDQFGIPVHVQGVIPSVHPNKDTRVPVVEKLSSDDTGHPMTLAH